MMIWMKEDGIVFGAFTIFAIWNENEVLAARVPLFTVSTAVTY